MRDHFVCWTLALVLLTLGAVPAIAGSGAPVNDEAETSIIERWFSWQSMAGWVHDLVESLFDASDGDGSAGGDTTGGSDSTGGGDSSGGGDTAGGDGGTTGPPPPEGDGVGTMIDPNGLL